MSHRDEVLAIAAGEDTEAIVNSIFKALPNDIVDEVALERISETSDGVARELITTAAVLTFSSAVAAKIFSLLERYMEERRQRAATELIYQAAKDNPTVLKILAELEKKHADVSVKIGKLGPDVRKSLTKI